MIIRKLSVSLYVAYASTICINIKLGINLFIHRNDMIYENNSKNKISFRKKQLYTILLIE
jgi:hypothetical protein